MPATGSLRFALLPDDENRTDESQQPGTTAWSEEDLKRAFAAAAEAGLKSYRVEIAPDGSLSIVVGAETDPAAGDPPDPESQAP